MNNNPRCLYDNTFEGFLDDPEDSILGILCGHYHGDTRTTTRDAWKDEISIMHTRLPEYYDGTYEYLRSKGINEI